MYVHLSSNESTVTNQTSPRQTSSLLLCLSQLGSGPYQVGRIWSRVRVSASFQKNFPPNYVIRQKKEESPGGLSGLGHFFFSCACQETKLVSQETASSSAERSRDQVAIQLCQGTGFDNVGHCLSLAARAWTQISVCKLPFPSTDTAVSLFLAKTVQRRPLLPREVAGLCWQPGCRIVGSHSVGIDHLGH